MPGLSRPSRSARRRTASGLAVGALALTLAACAGESTPPSASTAPEPSATATAAPASPSPAPTVDAAAVTCESLIPADLIDTFTAAGWTVRDDPFRVADVELAGGHWCTWGDFAGAASDNVQIYGWAPLDEETAAETQSALVSDGWVREEDDAGVFITENPDTTVSTDAQGYGMTLQFGEGWVTVSDTKEGLLVIVLPTP
jgi:hypothetical protein